MAVGNARFRGAYGAGPLHLLGTLGALSLTAYTISVIGLSALWNPAVWWQSILVWFLGAVVVHDLVLFPLYALTDRVIQHSIRSIPTSGPRQRAVSATNYVRIPVIAVGLLFLLFFPGIVQQGADTYLSATGQDQGPFLERWLLLSTVIFAMSAAAYAVRLLIERRSSSASTPASDDPENAGDL